MHRFAILIVLALMTACSSPEDIERVTGVDKSGSTATASATASSVTASQVDFEDNSSRDGAERTFAYSWPATVSAETELADLLTERRDTSLMEEKAEWAQSLADSPADCVSCSQRSLAINWKTVADLPRWLSLSADISTYTGGAHPNSGFDALVWDRQEKLAIEPLAFFRTPVALENAVAGRYCSQLDALREKRRGSPVESDKGGIFNVCPAIDELTVLLGSSGGKTFDRIGLLAAPYVAGSYAEGSYEITLPIDTQVLDAVRPEYAAFFTLRN